MADTIATRALSEPDRLLKRRRLDELLHRITHGAGADTSSRPALNNNIYEPSLSLEKYYLRDQVAVVAVPHHYPYNLYAEELKEDAMPSLERVMISPVAPKVEFSENVVGTPERLNQGPADEVTPERPSPDPAYELSPEPPSPDLAVDVYCHEVFDGDAISNASTPPPISPVSSEGYGPLPELDLAALFDLNYDEYYNEEILENEPSIPFRAAPEQPCQSPSNAPTHSAAEATPVDNQLSPERLQLPREQETPLDLSTKKEDSQPLVVGAWADSCLGWRALPSLRQIVLPAGLEGAPLTLALSPVNAVVEQVPNDTGLAFPCLDCGQLFCLQDRLAKHIASRHRKPGAKERAARAYRCDVCLSTFARSDMLTRHARLHTGVKPYSCGECGQVFTRSDHLATHQRTHTGEKPYKCALCDYAACRRDMISRHMRTHSKNYPFAATAPGATRGRRGRAPVRP